MQSHKDLDVWRAAIDMERDICELTQAYQNEKRYGIISQMRCSAVLIASYIAEGAARQGRNSSSSIMLE